MQFKHDTSPVAAEFRVVPKLNHPVIFDMPWFAECNPQIDWHNHYVRLGFSSEQHTVTATHADDSFFGTNIHNSN